MEKFIHVERCDSTQDILKEQLAHIATDELTVSCEHQTRGHGRGNNIWHDSPGTLCFSMTVKPHQQVTYTALEISLLIQQFFALKGKEVKVKWPNDLITIGEKKCGGVLVQNSGSHYYAGIGLNLFQNDHSYGDIYDVNIPFEKKVWAKDISHFIRQNRYNDTEILAQDWTKSCFHLNRKVKIIESDQETVGLFIGLGPFGEALLENAQGIHHLYNGSLRLF